MRTLLLLPLVAVLCAACSSTGPAKLGEATATPIKDLNLSRTEVPELLQAAKLVPYGVPAERNCSALAMQVKALEDLLPADFDAAPEICCPPTSTQPPSPRPATQHGPPTPLATHW